MKINSMKKHKKTRPLFTYSNDNGWTIQATCTCGWVGKQVPMHVAYIERANDEFMQHLSKEKPRF